MNVIITIQHPAHVHFFRNAIGELRELGHDVHVFAREKDLVIELLDAFDIDHTVLAGNADSTLGLVRLQLTYEYRLFRAAQRLDPDVLTAIGGVGVAHVASLLDAKSVIFLDSDGVLVNYLAAPFADTICTPRRFRTDFGSHHRFYDGYHELAYLHPNWFSPDTEGLRDHGVRPDEPVFVLRFAQWNAHHDIGHDGFSRSAQRELVSLLDERGQVYVSYEGELPAEFEQYRLPIPPHRIHDLLAVADLYVGDSGTMATEAALLGTPSVRSSSHVEGDDMSNFVELEAEYDLLRSYADESEAIDAIRDLLSRPDLKAEWARRRERLLEDKIDVTEFVVETLLEQVGERPTPVKSPA